jgi:hypothetical protein
MGDVLIDRGVYGTEPARVGALAEGEIVSDIGKRVKLVKWPHGGTLHEGMQGTILQESIRKVVVQWDELTYTKGMNREEIALIY